MHILVEVVGGNGCGGVYIVEWRSTARFKIDYNFTNVG